MHVMLHFGLPFIANEVTCNQLKEIRTPSTMVMLIALDILYLNKLIIMPK